ncbi:erythrocyte membrane protein 1, PfEMP1, putative [Plasmodium sp. DRC-Itaito]|nr:erythrocyte membrane protein 1, PfEMP1, putative [Plasmodium sp. DRC-Itaito]
MSGSTNCGKGGSSDLVKTIATIIQLEVQKEEQGGGGNVSYHGESKLKADFKQAQFGPNLGNKPDSDDPCNLNKDKHTNATNGNDPCKNKGDRFIVGQKWQPPKKEEVEDVHKEVLIPPRRRHMCTSNLENLETSNEGLSDKDKASHSLLGDVLLTAKEEAQKIIDQYKQQNRVSNLNDANNKNHKECICNAIKYSFADLGDIIRGRDLWSNENGNKNIQDKLKEIFKKIKDSTNIGVNTYQNDNDPYPKLRNHWWEANRSQIWDAMKCAKDGDGTNGTSPCENSKPGSSGPGSTGNRNPPGGSHRNRKGYRSQRGHSRGSGSSGGATSVPHEDYIPQKLRWLTEWSEWYCKTQKNKYEGVKTACEQCKNGNNCDKCNECKKACQDYKAEVDKWDKDWTTQKTQYEEFYTKATTSGGSTSDENLKYLYKFLHELHTENNKQSVATGGDPYGSAGGYIDKEAKTECQVQKNFCGDTSGNTNNVFRQYPNGYDAACSCQPPTPPVPKPTCTDNKILDTATYKQLEAQNEWESRDSGKSGESKLKGNLKDAKFGKNGDKTVPSGNICELTKEHTNDVRDYQAGVDSSKNPSKHDGPCTGKGTERFVIGREWAKQDKSKVRDGYHEVLFPPRRLDMCTSNLENLASRGGTPDLLTRNNVNDSFFGDVLLAAKEEGYMITQLLHNDTSRVCTAMKYSFADLGDIIRGKDIWDRGDDMKNLETYLQAIFKRIKEQVDPSGKTYTNSDANPPYTKVRDDWWSANRDQIWKAITCSAPVTATLSIPSTDPTTYKWKSPQCGRNDPNFVPVDDYIPQKLRWYTEWTENYCKQLDRNYVWLRLNCGACKKYKEKEEKKKESDKGKMTAERTKWCGMCKGMCEVYTKFVKEWEKQWKEMVTKYSELYNGSGSNGKDDDDITKETKTFLQKIKGTPECEGDKNKDPKNYQTLSEYVTSMGGTKNCIDAEQKNFDNTTGEDGAFAPHPKDYKKECVDPQVVTAPPSPPAAPREPKQDDACTIVGTILNGINGKDNVGSCMKKYNEKNTPPYPEWACDKDKFQSGNDGACMPPRRQKLCLYYLTHDMSGESDLRTAFIKTAAAETFLAWNYYINYGRGKKNSGGDKMLESGTIPPDFLRSMFYTYGDYRDLCVDKDIGNKKKPKSTQNNDVGNAIENIKKILKGDDKREKFWEDNGRDIWKGMLCGLSHTISEKGKQHEKQKEVQEKLTQNYSYENTYDPDNLEKGIGTRVLYTEFVPQFLRWFTEWADEFCLERSKELTDLVKKCKTCTLKDDKTKCEDKQKCKECQEQCKQYTSFIEKWKGYYTSQKTKFDTEKKTDKYQFVPMDDEQNTPAYRFLYQSLELFGIGYNCMEYPSKQPPNGVPTGTDMPQSLDEYPSDEYKNKCVCDDEVKTTKADSKDSSKATGPTTVGTSRDSGARSNTAGRGSGAGARGRGQGQPGKKRRKNERKMKKKWVKKTGSGGAAKSTKPPDPTVIVDTQTTKDGSTRTLEIISVPSTSPVASSEDDDTDTGVDDEDDDDDDDDEDNTIGTTSTGVEPNAAGVGTSSTAAVDESVSGPGKTLTNTQKQACEIAKDILKKERDITTGGIDNCNPKTEPFNWDCEASKFKDGVGPCMPPRRQKLCIHDLTQSISDRTKLREAFIKCAAKETHFSWYRYKREHIQENSQLQAETIPDDFLRSMKYSFGDYRDIFFGTDISSHNNISEVSQKIKGILKTKIDKTKPEKELLEEWWEENAKYIWEGMLCALQHGDKFTDNVKQKDPPNSFASRPQFLRWFTEWGEEYCKKRRKLELNVKKKCENRNDYEICKDNNNGNSCAKACKAYDEFVTKKKGQYEKQKKKFDDDKATKPLVHGYEDFTNKEAHDYLTDKCLDGTCSCMEKVKSTDGYWDKPVETYDNPILNKKCECSPASVPEPEAQSEEDEPEEKEPEEEEDVKKMSCVEKTAKSLREEAKIKIEGDIIKNLNGSGLELDTKCKEMQNVFDNQEDGTKKINYTKVENAFPSNTYSCDNQSNERFQIGRLWECNVDTTDEKNKLCVPPRRKHMCLNDLTNINASTITDSNKLLKEVQKIAKNEGIDILKYLKPQKESDFCEICDAMKYSFADLGDIIRGRSKINLKNDDNIEQNLKTIFEKIHGKLNNDIKSKYHVNGDPKYTKLREAWWDTNRKDIWDAMTCAAPNEAKLKKRLNNPGESLQTTNSLSVPLDKCGHNSEPPDYDYIPERYRFLQEWSEYYCKVLNKKNDEMKNECPECLKNGTGCDNEKDKGKCQKCKNKCEEYKKHVGEWKSQFDEQNQLYKDLYIKGTTASTKDADGDSAIKYIKKLQNICDSPGSADKYLHMSTHCMDYFYTKDKSEDPNYAFSSYPKDYKKACKSTEKSSTSGSSIDWSSLWPKSLFPRMSRIKFYPKIGIGLLHPVINIVADPTTVHSSINDTTNTVILKSKEIFEEQKKNKDDALPVKPPPNIPPIQKDEPSVPMNEILSSTVPVGLSFALGSIALLYYLKKKTTAKSPDLFRVLEIPQKDGGMPTYRSANKYVPYKSGHYAGKTYIYVEENDSDDTYIGNISSSDVTTSSSDSEVDELDINEIYKPLGGKHRTLIDIILKPSGANTRGTTQNSGDNTRGSSIPGSIDIVDSIVEPTTYSDTTPSGTDIVDTPYSDTTNSDIPSTSGNHSTSVTHSYSDNHFIIQIQDRQLGDNNTYIYDVGGISSGTTTPSDNMDIVGTTTSSGGIYSETHVSPHIYTGIDLIHDSLYSDRHIDIYEELLKRKEKEQNMWGPDIVVYI